MKILSRLNHLKVVINDKNKKKWFVIFKEVIIFSLYKKALPTDYFRKFLYRKEIKDIKNYLSFKEYNSILSSKRHFFQSVNELLNNKLIFYTLCKQHNLPSPKLMGHNINNHFFEGITKTLIEDTEVLKQLFNRLLELNLETSIFLKPIIGMGGSGCFIINKENLNSQIEKYGSTLLSNSYIFQDCIVQHQKINAINSKAVNTLRIIVYIDGKNIPRIVSSLMRFGVGNTVTDNAYTGGLYIPINHEEGIIEGIGRKDIAKGGETFTHHPDTNMQLNGFKVPFYNEACELAKMASSYFPNRIGGWDIAISENGPILIEGNHNPSLHMSDVAYGGYCQHPMIKEILSEI